MTPDQIQQQQNDLMARMAHIPYGTQAYFSAQKQLGQLNAMAPQSAVSAMSTSAGAGDDWQKTSRDRITALTEGRSTELANDPRMNQAMDFFGQVLNGSKMPFSEETQRAQLNQQANGTAAANAAQLRALEEAIVAQGGSLNDPSFQAKKEELMSQRQGQNLDALGRMLAQAGTANFNAQAQGANSLAGIRAGQNAQINSMNLAGAAYRGQDFRDTPSGAQAGGGGFSGMGTIGGGGSTQNFQGGYQTGAASAGNNLAGRSLVQQPAQMAPAQVAQPIIRPQPMPVAMQPLKPAIPQKQSFGGLTARPIGPGQF